MTAGYDPYGREPDPPAPRLPGGAEGASGPDAERPDAARHAGPTWTTPTAPMGPAAPASGAPGPAWPQPPSYRPAPAGYATPPGGYPAPTSAFPVSSSGGYQPPVVQRPPGAGRHRLQALPGALALLLVLALAVVVVFQAQQIGRLGRDLDRANQKVAEAETNDDNRLDTLEGRASALETEAGKAFNPEAVATAALPSVFRVAAGDFTGTAFAVGKPNSSGGTNLFTNFHVVEQVWERGDREVSIERRDQSFPATIVKVDKQNDVAQLTTPNKFTGLVTATEPVKAGQQIVVVGAPLGLEDTVTTGVVSAFRKLEDGSGTVIQFSAPINPGNSGGPVINAKKQVVGIATAKARNAEGIGLAVPIKTACDQFQIC
jgi:putative serine protease PepD